MSGTTGCVLKQSYCGLQGVYKNKFISWTTGCVLIQNHFMEYRVCIKTKAWVWVCIKWTTGRAFKQNSFQGLQGVC